MTHRAKQGIMMIYQKQYYLTFPEQAEEMAQMYESYEVLKIKEKSGIDAARRELEFRKKHREKIDLTGFENTALYMVRTDDI